MDKKTLLGLFIIAAFALSILPTAGAQETTEQTVLPKNPAIQVVDGTEPLVVETTSTPQAPQETSTGVKEVSWDLHTEDQSNSWEWTSGSWEFGPAPSYTMAYGNGTPVRLEDTVWFGETIQITIEVPLAALQKDRTLGQTGFRLSFWEYTPEGGSSYEISGSYGYDFQNDNWYANAWEQNYTNPIGGGEPAPVEVVLFDLNTDTRLVNFDTPSQTYTVYMEGTFASSLPSGRYNFGLDIYDDQWNWVQPSYRAWESGSPPYRDIWVNTPYNPFDWGGQEGYKTYIANRNSEKISSVKRGIPFQFMANITSSVAFENISLEMDLPWEYVKRVNKTETYQFINETTGGWVWDANLGSYTWDPNAPVTLEEEVYGPHIVEQSRWVDRSVDLGDDYWASEKLFLFYFPDNNTFVAKIGYRHGYQDPNTFEWVENLFLRDIDPGVIEDNLVLLNGGLWTDLGDDEYRLSFNLTVAPAVRRGTSLNYDFRAYRTDGQELWSFDNSGWGQIPVETPVAKVSVFGPNGKPAGNSLRLKDQQSFLLQADLLGHPDPYSLDAATLYLRGYDYSWSENMSLWSELEIVVRYDYVREILDVQAYNSTSRNYLAFGTYWDYVEVSKEGYHWAYNRTLADWVWVYGTYTDWEYAEVEGYYWQYENYNHQTGEWTTDWIPRRSDLNKVADNSTGILTINERSVKTFADGKFRLSLNISVTPQTPELRYNFEAGFESREFGQDYEAGWGLHTSEIWLREKIYQVNGQYAEVLDRPLYLSYGGQNYIISEQPYVEVERGVFEFIKPLTEYDFWSGEETTILANWEYDHQTGEQMMYYTLTNGTKLYIERTNGAKIYEIQLNITHDGQVVDNTTVFESFHEYAELVKHYWDDDAGEEVRVYEWYLINGSRLRVETRNYELHFNGWYNPKTDQHTFNDTLYYVLTEETILVENPNYYLPLYLWDATEGRYVLDQYFEVQNEWVEWDWRTQQQYVVDKATGVRYYIQENLTSNQWEDQYYVTIGGVDYTLAEGGWTITRLYPYTYNGEDLEIPGRFTRQLFYVEGAPELSLLPTNNAPAFWEYQLLNTITQGGLVPTAKSIDYLGSKVNLVRTTNGWDLRYASDNTLLDQVPLSAVKADKYVVVLNGEYLWNSTMDGYTIQYGQYNTRTGEFEASGSMAAETAQDANDLYVREYIYNNYYYLLNASVYPVEEPIKFSYRPAGMIVEVDILGDVGNASIITWEFWSEINNWDYAYRNITYTNGTTVTFIPDDDISYGKVYPYVGVRDPNTWQWFFNYEGAWISEETWVDEWGWRVNWGNYWSKDIVEGKWLMLVNQWGAEEIDLEINSYNFTYGFPGFFWDDKVVGWFEGVANPEYSGRDMFYTNYESLINITNPADPTEVRVQYGEFAVVWKVQINGSAIIYVSQRWYEEITDPETGATTGFRLEALNGSVYYFETYEDVVYLDEYHQYVTDDGMGNQFFEFQGQNYDTNGLDYERHYTSFINNSGVLVEIDFRERWTPLISVHIQAGDFVVETESEPIYKRIEHRGYPYRWKYVSENIFTDSETWEIVVGNPQNGMWGFQAYTVNPDNGAFDMDGDLSTTNDQFFIFHQWSSKDTHNYTNSRLYIDIMWDPNNATDAQQNEYYLRAWMGYSTDVWQWEWSETFVWYFAGNKSLVDDNTMTWLRSEMLNEDGNPAAGYWGVAWMLDNTTWEDLQAEAAANGWDWLLDNTWTAAWLDFGFSQDYYSVAEDNGDYAWSEVSLRNQWTGFTLYNDTNNDGVANFGQNEVTHNFIPSNVGAVEFTTPGAAFGNMNDTGSVWLTANDTHYNTSIPFGVQFFNVSGTTFPVMQDAFGNWINIWAWTGGDFMGSDLNSFANRPSESTIDEVAFQLRFDVMTAPDQPNANATLKLDQTVGNWDVEFTGGRKNLVNYSLAITYLSAVQTATAFDIRSGNGAPVTNTDAVQSDKFSFSAEGREFANAILEGTYIWGKNESLALNSTTYSVPVAQYEQTFKSDNEDSNRTVGFQFSSEEFFMAIGFPMWDGYSVFQDPTFSAVAAVAGTTTSSGGANAPTITVVPTDVEEVQVGTAVVLSWTAVDDDPESWELYDEGGSLLQSGSWTSGQAVSVTINALLGTNEYTMIFYDLEGNAASDTVSITGTEDNVAPVLTQTPTSQTAVEGTELTLSWVAVDNNPATYTLTDGLGTNLKDGSWSSGQTISYTLTVVKGQTTYTIEFVDTEDLSITHSVVITGDEDTGPSGDEDDPVITSRPSDTTSVEGTTLTLSWVATDADPTTFEVEDNLGNTLASGPWTSGQTISVTITVNLGVVIYTATFSDGQGNTASDSVTITGEPKPSETTGQQSTFTASTTQGEVTSGSIPGYEAIYLILAITLVGVVTLARRRRQ